MAPLSSPAGGVKRGVWWARAGFALALLVLAAWAWRRGWLDGFALYGPDIAYLAPQHLELVAISGGLAILIGLPLGVWLSRPFMRRYADVLMQALNVGATIPTLAVLALSMSFLGIGRGPAIFALWLATLLPIVRNAYAGLKAAPPPLIEAATGMGMTRLQILWQVELPNALYVILAGIRTALAINVGTAPLAFLIGAGGLGELIFQGIALNDFQMLLAGAVPTALLAVAIDAAFGPLQLWLIPRGLRPKS